MKEERLDFAGQYHRVIDAIEHATGMGDSLLHVHAGMAVLLLARIVTRRSLATPVPFLIVCVAEAANEILDRLYSGRWQIDDTVSDIINTIFWPAVLMIGLRLRKAHVFVCMANIVLAQQPQPLSFEPRNETPTRIIVFPSSATGPVRTGRVART